MAYPIDADTTPLAEALAEIAKIVETSESDAERMVAMLNDIEAAVLTARVVFMDNVLNAQKAAKADAAR